MSGFLSAMRIAGSGLAAQRTRLNLVSSNLANADTTRTAEGGPYRRRDPVFRAVPIGDNFNSSVNKLLENNAHEVEVETIIEDQTPARSVYDPNHPDADTQGYVLYPNIEIVEEMVNMMTAARSYAANATVMETIKQMANRAIDLIR